MTNRCIMLTIVLGIAAAIVQGLALLAQTATPPARYISAEQWRKDLDASKPTLGPVAGQTAKTLSTQAGLLAKSIRGLRGFPDRTRRTGEPSRSQPIGVSHSADRPTSGGAGRSSESCNPRNPVIRG